MKFNFSIDWKKVNWPLVAVTAVSFLLFVIYVTVNRQHGLAFFDASEYATHIEGSGIPHAPGYPLYTMLGKFMELFVGDPFTAQFLISVLSIAVASLALWRTFRESDVWDPWALVLTLVLFWSSYFVKLYTMLPEVFMMNVALYALLGWGMDRWYRDPTAWRLFAVFVLYGLGFSHHHTLALTLPAFFVLVYWRRHVIEWNSAALAAVTGSIVGTLPIWYMFYASSPAPDYTYYVVQSLQDLLVVVLRRGYGTFSLSVFKDAAPMSEMFKHVGKGFLKNFNYVWVLCVAPLAVGASMKGFRERFKREPFLVYSLVTLFLFFAFFVPKNNLPLTFEKYKQIIWRFVTIPGFLFLYPAYFGFRRALRFLPRPELVFYPLLILLLASNVVGSKELRFGQNELLTKHIEMGYQTILGQIESMPVIQGNPKYLKCVIFVRPDALVFGIRYFNEFKSSRSCFFYTTSSFSGQFRARNEEILQQAVLGADYPKLLMQYKEDASGLLAILFDKLKQSGFRIFYFYATDSVIFTNPNFRYRPIGNIQELVLTTDAAYPLSDLADNQVRYLRAMDAYLDDLAGRKLPKIVLDESVSYGLFQNIGEYRRLLQPLYAPNPWLGALDDQVHKKFDALMH